MGIKTNYLILILILIMFSKYRAIYPNLLNICYLCNCGIIFFLLWHYMLFLLLLFFFNFHFLLLHSTHKDYCYLENWYLSGLNKIFHVALADWLSWLESHPISYTKTLWIQFPVRPHTLVAGLIPSQAADWRQLINVSFSNQCFSLSLLLSLQNQ